MTEKIYFTDALNIILDIMTILKKIYKLQTCIEVGMHFFTHKTKIILFHSVDS